MTPLRYLALGDSYTIGEGVPEPDRWPARLVARLEENGLSLAPPRYLATTGWSSDELAAAIAAHPLRGPFDLVSLLIGVNDQYRGYPAASRHELIADLINQAISLAGERRRVLIVSIPDWSVTAFAKDSGRDLDAMAQQIDAYNDMIRTQAAAAGVAWIDVTDCSRRHPEELVEDGLHPDGRQYLRWSGLILPAALRALQGRSRVP
ncbi:SGNH/GDSL hydrolase family protein [Frateuria aurantia]